MEYQSFWTALVALWPVSFILAVAWWGRRQDTKMQQYQLNDAIKMLHVVAMQKRGRLWK